MTKLPSGDRCGGDPLGLLFGGGECSHNPLGFRSVVAVVGDGEAATEIFRSMMHRLRVVQRLLYGSCTRSSDLAAGVKCAGTLR
jgi:hypothetical protein